MRIDLTVLVAVFAAAAGLASPAHAYLDAGTGSLILQMLLGGFAGVAVVAKLYWARLRMRFTAQRGDRDPEDGSRAA